MKTDIRRFLAAVVLTSGLLTAQEATRTAEIEAARAEKEKNPPADEKPFVERALLIVKERRLLEKWEYGWHGIKPRIGALVTGSGFAAGPEFLRDDIRGGDISVRVTTQFTFSLYQLYEAELSLPKLADGHMFASVNARHRNLPRMPYYGPGPDSSRTRTDYRLEDTRYGFTFGVRPVRPVILGVTGDLLQVNVGPGNQKRWSNTDALFTEAQTPGIQRQTDFFQSGVFAAFDTRDVPGGPRSGTLLRADYLYNKDIDLKANTHKRLNMEAQQYFGFFNKRRVIALRARSELTWKNPGQVVPFYLQPILGGSDDLRGFRPYRFYDDNLMVFNAEYRWEVFAGLDMALFADAGKVFHSKQDWDVHNLESSYGFGFRFNARNRVFMRIDTGFSHEGFQVWVKFNNVF